MIVRTTILKFKTPGAPEFIDLTDEIIKAVTESNVKNGIVTVYSKHTTAAIRINEHEAGIKHDFKELVAKMFPSQSYYRHNDMSVRTENIDCDDDRCDKNGHSHQIHMFLGTSETIPVVDGRMTLGRWQRVFLIELCSPRNREVVLQVMGE
jgi:secondary thiamine-phosphate synthase enzyme